MQEETESRLRSKRLRLASGVLGSVFAGSLDESALVKVRQAALRLGVTGNYDDEQGAQTDGLQEPPQVTAFAST
jgi:hypothetical protein